MKRYFLILVSLLPGAGWPACGQEFSAHKVQLRERVAITGETIRLSDLLPADAPAALRASAASLELGRAPLPGSVRLLNEQQIAARLGEENEILRRLAMPAQLLVERTGWPIRPKAILSAVADFLHKHRWEQSHQIADSVEWAEGVAARDEVPQLQVTGVKMNTSQNILEARLRCTDASLCGSFLARISLKGWIKTARATSPRNRILGPASGNLPARKKGNAGLVRRGTAARLTMEGNGVRILLPVICLQAGDVGDQVLVRATGRQVFSAQVVAAGQLHAAF